MTPYAPLLKRFNLATTTTLSQLENRSMTRLGGMVSAVQQGFSKKTNKPYAMVTLEDLEGSVQLLLMNENCEKLKHFCVQGQAIMVVGEVNTGEDKAKIFPQDIFPLAEAPARFTRQVHWRLSEAQLQGGRLQDALGIAQNHPGRCPLFLAVRLHRGALVFIEAHERFAVSPSMELQKAVDDTFGENTYYAKVDSSLPERAARRWEKRASDGDEN